MINDRGGAGNGKWEGQWGPGHTWSRCRLTEVKREKMRKTLFTALAAAEMHDRLDLPMGLA